MKFGVGTPEIGLTDVVDVDFMLFDYDYDVDEEHELPPEVELAIIVLRKYAASFNK
jgi:hypothetical protein